QFINICQEAMLGELSLASTAAEFRERIPKAVDILRWTAKCVLDRAIPVHQFILTKSVSRTLTEYVVLTATAAALKQLEKRGFPVEPGESVRYVLMDARARDSERKVRVAEFLEGDETPDAWEYIKLLARSGDELRHPLFRIGQDRTAAPEEGQALLEHREGAIERQVPARERLDLLLEGLHRLLEGRLRRHRDATSSWTCTWTRPSWNRTARASPSSISEARETTWPSIRSAIA